MATTFMIEWAELSAMQKHLLTQAAGKFAACDNANTVKHLSDVLYNVVCGVYRQVAEVKGIKVGPHDYFNFHALRDRAVTEALELEAGLRAKLKIANVADYPPYVQEGIAYFRANLGKYFADYVFESDGAPRRKYKTDWDANSRVSELFKQFEEQGYLELVAQLQHEQVVWRRTHLLGMHEPGAARVDWMAAVDGRLDDLQASITGEFQMLRSKVDFGLEAVASDLASAFPMSDLRRAYLSLALSKPSDLDMRQTDCYGRPQYLFEDCTPA